MSEDALQVIECTGDPRAMGEAQGRSLRSTIRACVSGSGVTPRGRAPYSLRPFISGPVLAGGMGREIVRHYPHLSERIQGLARGADLPTAALMGAFVRAAENPGSAESPIAEAPAIVRCGGGEVELSRTLERRNHSWLVRRSVPQVGFRSVELTVAWLATAVMGVNEAGIAVTLAPHAPRTNGALGDIAPSAALLVQECLQRFESLEGCLDWALKRPVSGRFSLALADATGAAAVVDVTPNGRVVTPAKEGLTAVGGHHPMHDALTANGSTRSDWPEPGSDESLYVAYAEPTRKRLRIISQPSGAETILPVLG